MTDVVHCQRNAQPDFASDSPLFTAEKADAFFPFASVLLLWNQQPRQTLGPSMTLKLSVVV